MYIAISVVYIASLLAIAITYACVAIRSYIDTLFITIINY